MTIVAGFLAQDGIVMCGDTMYTGGMKIHQPKLISTTFPDSSDTSNHLSMTFALAGNEANAKMAIEDCIEGLKGCPPEKRTLRAVTTILRAAILGINRDYVDGHTESEKYGLQFGLIIGAWIPRGGGCKLWSTAGAGLVSRDDYYCQGSGEYLGHYLIRPVFRRSMSIAEVVLLAIQTIYAAKKHDPSCGGDTQFVTISEGGAISATVPYNAIGTEDRISSFEKMGRQLLFDIANKSLDDAGFDLKLAAFVEYARILRASFPEKAFDRIVEILKMSAEKASAQSDPESTTGWKINLPPSPE